MAFAGVRLMLVSVALLRLATAGFAQASETRGTVRRVDAQTGMSSVARGAGQIVLSDGSIVGVTPSTVVQRGAERLSLDALQPGWEVVVSVPPAPAAEASRIDVVWAPTASVR